MGVSGTIVILSTAKMSPAYVHEVQNDTHTPQICFLAIATHRQHFRSYTSDNQKHAQRGKQPAKHSIAEVPVLPGGAQRKLKSTAIEVETCQDTTMELLLSQNQNSS
jgi:hypothetical protein